MKFVKSKFLATLMTLVLVFTTLSGTVLAGKQVEKNAVKVGQVIETVDGVDIVLVAKNKNKVTVMMEKDGEKLYANINKLTREVTMQEKGKFIVKNYDVKIKTAVNGELDATIIDKESKKEFKVKGDKNEKNIKAKAQFVITGSMLAIYGLYALYTLLFVASAIVIGNVLYIAVTEAQEYIEEEKRKNNAKYFYAVLRSGVIYIGSYTTQAVASSGMVAGSDFFAVSGYYASAAARLGSPTKANPLIHEPHKANDPNYLWHYHIAPYNSAQGHCWFK